MRLADRRVWGLAGSIVAISGAAWGIGGSGLDGEALVQRGDVVVRMVAPGVVESTTDEVALAFDASGRVAQVLVEEGDRIQADQLLARLDDRLARANVARAEAGLAAAVADRALAFRGARAEEIRAAESELQAAQSQADDRVATAARAERLSRAAAIPGAELDVARHASTSASAAADVARARLALIRQGTRVEERQKAIAGVAAAQAELDLARTVLTNTEIRAPFAGVVTRRLVEVGEQVTTVPPTVALRVADLDHLQLRTEIDEADVSRVRVGQRGYATAPAYGERRFSGRVVRVGRALGRKEIVLDDPRARVDTRVLEVLFALDAPSALPLGLRLDVHIETEGRYGVLIAPLAGLARGGSNGRTARVTVLGPAETERQIRVGLDDGVHAEILSGLREGERIAVR